MLLATEALLRLLPVSTATLTGYHHDPLVLTYPTHHTWQVSTGWDLRNPQRMTSNNWGFAAGRDFTANPQAVALIGDSYVEASMLAAPDRPGAQLETLLGGRPVYSMAMPGTSLLDYAQRIRLAQQNFGIRDVVLLVERYDARQAVCGADSGAGRCLDLATMQVRNERPPPASALKRVARQSALAQYLGSQLKVRPGQILQALFTRTTPQHAPRPGSPGFVPTIPSADQIAQAQASVDAVVDAFFADARPFLKGRLVIVVDGRRTGPAEVLELVDFERTSLIERLRAGGAVVHDLELLYGAYRARSPRSLDVGSYDEHLNPMGVHIAMGAAAESLRP